MRPPYRFLAVPALALAVCFSAFAQGPSITNLAPTSVVAGSGSFTLTVNGSGFFQCDAAPCLGITWAPSTGASTFIPALQPFNSDGISLNVTIPANLITAPDLIAITVTASGGASNTAYFQISPPVPTITSLAPSSAAAGGPSFTLTINGSGFYFACEVQPCLNVTWQPSSGAATSLAGTANASATQLTVTVPASLIAGAGTASITVTAVGGTSNAASFAINPPAPTITSLQPSSVTAGSNAITLTINGTNFTASTVASWGGVPLAVAFVSSTQLTASVPASLLATPGTVPITAKNGTVVSNAVMFTINPRSTPVLTSLQPTSVAAGGAAFTLTVTGTGFLENAAILWNGSELATKFMQSTSLSALISSSRIAAPGTVMIAVQNPDGSQSNSLTFTIEAVPPVITAITPASAPVGGAAFTLTVSGSGFVSGAAVVWNTANLTTTFGSATQLSAAVSANLLASAGSASVTVVNPDGTASNAVTFTISSAPPSITSISPATAIAGGAAFTLTVKGAGFVSGAAVQWNGSGLATTFVSAAQLSAAVPANLIAKAGSATVTVANPDGGVSGQAAFTIVPPPVITRLSPNAVDAAGAAFTLTVFGSGFVSGAAVQWNGTLLTQTEFVSASQLTASVPASLIAAPGAASITVVNPDGGTSAAATFTINVPPPPTITFSAPSTAQPASPQTITFSTGSAYPFDIAGTMTLSFAPDVVNPITTDPAIQFASGGTTFSFEIPANTTTVPSVTVQTGTTAGTITVTLKLVSEGQVILDSDITIQVSRAAPVIQSVKLTPTSSGIEVDVTGFATPREVTQATFTFTAAAGFTLTTSTFTVDASSLFTPWYQSQDSQPFGSQFKYAETFSVQGGAQGVASVSVTLTNSVGTSQAVSSQ